MFFSTESTATFESITEVIRAYPKWKLNIREGNEMIFYQKAKANDDDFRKFWDRIENYPQDTVFNSIDTAIRNIEERQIVIHLSEKVLRQYFMENPSKTKPKTILSKEERRIENMIVTENSPLGPILTFGCNKLLEKGIIDILDEKWIGKKVNSVSSAGGSAADVLSIGQVMLIFVFIGTGLVLAIVVLIVEDIYYLINRRRVSRKIKQVFNKSQITSNMY